MSERLIVDTELPCSPGVITMTVKYMHEKFPLTYQVPTRQVDYSHDYRVKPHTCLRQQDPQITISGRLSHTNTNGRRCIEQSPPTGLLSASVSVAYTVTNIATNVTPWVNAQSPHQCHVFWGSRANAQLQTVTIDPRFSHTRRMEAP